MTTAMQEDDTTHTRVTGLTCEFLTNPLGLDEPAPRLSWRLETLRAGARQTAYRLVVASAPERLDAPDLWDTGNIESDQCLDIIYAGQALSSRQSVWWRVRVCDERGQWSSWSEVARFEMGLLDASDWTAEWVGRVLDCDGDGSPLPPSLNRLSHDTDDAFGTRPCPHLRREFRLPSAPVRARLYITARGLFEAWINGRRVGDDLFAPGWTNYHKRIAYHMYDVTGLLHEGENAVGAILGDGWYAGHLLWSNTPFHYGEQLSLLAQLEIETADGQRMVVASGTDWKTAFGPILASDLYHGEVYDARREVAGWDAPGFDDSGWSPATVFPVPSARLVARRSLPVRRQEELPVVAQSEPVPGAHVFDLGQNMVGWARLRVRGRAGQTITIRYAEMLNADGTLYTANLRKARCTDVYTCRGGGREEIYEPRFTFHGFRYVELTGLDEQPGPEAVTGIVVHSEIPRAGAFECSNALVNRLQLNIEWGQRGNFLEVPTDCPQRDERLGWTGDAQVFIPTACCNRDVAAFFTKWCEDMNDALYDDGSLPYVVPDVLQDGFGGSEKRGCAAWADAAVIVPWTIHLHYGDTRILERNYDMMAGWVEWQRRKSDGMILGSAWCGDWLAIDLFDGNPSLSPTPCELIATAYFARTTAILAEIAKRLGKRTDAERYSELAGRIQESFVHEFITPAGRVAGESQTGYLLALGFDLVPAERQTRVVEHLVRSIEERGWHLTTGFVGTPLLAPVLTRFGRVDVAYKLLLQETYPSWLYSVLQGATTMWERWNSYSTDKGFGDAGMNSFNHYAYGAIGEWLYATVGGINLDPAHPGYQHIIIKPQPPTGAPESTAITWASAELMTRYGRVACRWERAGDGLTVEATIPPNTTATVILPGQEPFNVAAGMHRSESK